ncbi:hypothetical protein [Pedobacter sp. WC2423]|uniref:hypothetical protein n=1 Tax=Pedobacter sp. WC2423 TaxID=3234142 RepID=UPI0034657C5C
MPRTNDLMTLKGFDRQSKKRDLILEQPFSNTDIRHYGMPITPCAALEMIGRFQDQVNTDDVNDPFRNVYWVEFSKASIFRVLSYENCEYVRFYLAIPDKDGKDASLTLEGVDSTGEVIARAALLDVAAAMQAQKKVSNTAELDEDAIYKKMNYLLPPIEEKGNGGSPFLEAKNVKSMKDFLESQSQYLKEMDFAEFIKSFYNYAKEKF